MHSIVVAIPPLQGPLPKLPSFAESTPTQLRDPVCRSEIDRGVKVAFGLWVRPVADRFSKSVTMVPLRRATRASDASQPPNHQPNKFAPTCAGLRSSTCQFLFIVTIRAFSARASVLGTTARCISAVWTAPNLLISLKLGNNRPRCPSNSHSSGFQATPQNDQKMTKIGLIMSFCGNRGAVPRCG